MIVDGLLGEQMNERLAQMVEQIGTYNVVLLGENAHGVAEYSQLKGKLVELLHRSYGFEVLAFEAGMIECFGAGGHIKTVGARSAMALSLYPIWQTEDILRLFEYVEGTQHSSHPLRVIGIDPRPRNRKNTFLQDFVRLCDPDAGHQLDMCEEMTKMLARRGFIAGDEDRAQFLSEKERLTEAYLTAQPSLLRDPIRADSEAGRVCIRVLDSRLALLDVLLDEQPYFDFRERWLADNLAWVAQSLYQGRKIVVWAHNYHIRRKQSAVDGDRTMGESLNGDFRDSSSSVGFYCGRGRAVWNDRTEYDIPAVQDQTMEARLLKTYGGGLFVDIRHPAGSEEQWMHAPCMVMSWGVNAEEIIPSEQYDGVVVVDEVSPPKFVL